jgi:hypothetical protein
MNCPKISRLLCAIAVLVAACVAGTRPASAQTLTSGSLSGNVIDQSGGALPGVTVNAVHEPTGTQYTAVTDAEGRFQIPNVRVGGPYTVTATLSGFADQKHSDLTVSLGDTKTVDFKMGVAAVSETITVVGQSVFSETRAGTASNVSQAAIESLPTISRSLTDMARTSPYFNETNSNGGDSFLSVAGRNNRYNNISIDGAVNNDVFGLAASGTPGGQTGTQPISLDAIQEFQLVVAPYDVRQGGFSGGSVNAITKSGTNSYSGTAFFYGRSQKLVGTIPSVTDPGNPATNTKVGKFSDRQGGFSFGGPIVHSKAFFFGNLDLGRKSTPNGWSIDGSTGQPFLHQAEAERLISILKNRYNYDPGGLGEFSKVGNSDKVFLRADFNLAANHQLTVRNNYVFGVAQQSGTTPSQLIYIMPGNFYEIDDRLTSTVGQLNSTFNNRFNELRVTYQRERNKRDPGQPFPHIQVDLDASTNFRAGSELSSQANELDQDIWEITDDFTLLKGSHTITLGTHNEFFKFRNLFIQNKFGQYRFASLDALQAGIAGLYAYTFSNTADPRQSARFHVRQFGFYAGDQWRARANLTLTYGMRFDFPIFPDKPNANPLAINTFGFATDVAPSPAMYSPRFGFNWDMSGGGSRKQIRGGAGLFVGRTPYVWLSNQYSNNGLDYTTINTGAFAATKTIPFVADPNNQPKSVTGSAAGVQTINVIDPDYQFPTVIRGNLATDHELGFLGLTGTAEVLFSTNVKEIKYQNLNYIPVGTLPDGRPRYGKLLASANDVVLLTNTSEGGQWSVSYSINRPFRNGLSVGGSYLYGRSESIMDGTSSVAYSNWAGTYVGADINNPPLTRSDFDVRHRVNMSASVPIPLWKDLKSTASVYYNTQSGRPYTIVFNTDVNTDGRSTNDLIFVPASEGQVLVTNGTWAQLDAFLSSDDATKDHRGQIVPRNAGRAPRRNELSVRYAVSIPTRSRAKVDLTADIFNLLNLINDQKGWIYYPNFGGPTIIAGTLDAATGKYIYNLQTIASPTFRTFTRDDLRSRWQAQFGARVRF